MGMRDMATRIVVERSGRRKRKQALGCFWAMVLNAGTGEHQRSHGCQGTCLLHAHCFPFFERCGHRAMERKQTEGEKVTRLYLGINYLNSTHILRARQQRTHKKNRKRGCTREYSVAYTRHSSTAHAA